MSNKPREFWIQMNEEGNHYTGRICWATFPGDEPAEKNYIKVIEYSAVASLQEELDKTTECLIAEQNMREELQKERDAFRVAKAKVMGELNKLEEERDEYREALEKFRYQTVIVEATAYVYKLINEVLAKYSKEEK